MVAVGADVVEGASVLAGGVELDVVLPGLALPAVVPVPALVAFDAGSNPAARLGRGPSPRLQM